MIPINNFLTSTNTAPIISLIKRRITIAPCKLIITLFFNVFKIKYNA